MSRILKIDQKSIAKIPFSSKTILQSLQNRRIRTAMSGAIRHSIGLYPFHPYDLLGNCHVNRTRTVCLDCEAVRQGTSLANLLKPCHRGRARDLRPPILLNMRTERLGLSASVELR